jgi:uncharacterized protein YjbJ (UPF0337 family)
MDKDRIGGAGKQAVGSVQEAVRKMTGDKKTEAEGAAKKAEGKIQNTVGGVKGTVRVAIKERWLHLPRRATAWAFQAAFAPDLAEISLPQSGVPSLVCGSLAALVGMRGEMSAPDQWL